MNLRNSLADNHSLACTENYCLPVSLLYIVDFFSDINISVVCVVLIANFITYKL
jgi:hypothetical protein